MFANQQDCQNGLVLEGHSDGYRITPLRQVVFCTGFSWDLFMFLSELA